MKGDYPVRMLCDLLGVAPSGYYRWSKKLPSVRRSQDKELGAKVAQIHHASRKNYGAPRVVAEMRALGTPISKRRCSRLLRELRLAGRKRARRLPRTTNSNHAHPVAPNLLPTTAITGPNQVWVTDITYLRTGEGWVYLAAVIDLWSRLVVGWAMASSLHTPLVLSALRKAERKRAPRGPVIHHSDRGSQYACGDYRRELERLGMVASMSRAGNCYDNAAMESFWSTLKTETDLNHQIPATRLEAELVVFDYIESFYNRTRRHSSLGYQSPVVFESINQN